MAPTNLLTKLVMNQGPYYKSLEWTENKSIIKTDQYYYSNNYDRDNTQ